MGIWYAKKCEPVVHGSVINLSDDCVQFMETGKAPRKTILKKNFPLEEQKYFSRLKTLDDMHSKNSGVDFEGFKKMANSLEDTLKSNKAIPCAKRRLLNCLRENEFCMIKCRKELDKFLDCVDATRLEVLKLKLQNEIDLQNRKKSGGTGDAECPPVILQPKTKKSPYLSTV